MHRGTCGIDCAKCPSYIAYHTDDNSIREKLVAKLSTAEYKMNVEDFNCAGCKATDGVLFKFCSDCEIRTCGIEKDVLDCSYCSEFPCSKIDDMTEKLGSDRALNNLKALKKSRESL